MDRCVSYLRFPVSHSMAPLSRLLIYYVRENGEGVTDSLQIPVKPEFENQVWKQNYYNLIYPEKSTAVGTVAYACYENTSVFGYAKLSLFFHVLFGGFFCC